MRITRIDLPHRSLHPQPSTACLYFASLHGQCHLFGQAFQSCQFPFSPVSAVNTAIPKSAGVTNINLLGLLAIDSRHRTCWWSCNWLSRTPVRLSAHGVRDSGVRLVKKKFATGRSATITQLKHVTCSYPSCFTTNIADPNQSLAIRV